MGEGREGEDWRGRKGEEYKIGRRKWWEELGVNDKGGSQG